MVIARPQRKVRTTTPRQVDIVAVIEVAQGQRQGAWHSTQVRVRHTDPSAYVWPDYAMIRNMLRCMRNLCSLEALL